MGYRTFWAKAFFVARILLSGLSDASEQQAGAMQWHNSEDTELKSPALEYTGDYTELDIKTTLFMQYKGIISDMNYTCLFRHSPFLLRLTARSSKFQSKPKIRLGLDFKLQKFTEIYPIFAGSCYIPGTLKILKQVQLG